MIFVLSTRVLGCGGRGKRENEKKVRNLFCGNKIHFEIETKTNMYASYIYRYLIIYFPEHIFILKIRTVRKFFKSTNSKIYLSIDLYVLFVFFIRIPLIAVYVVLITKVNADD